MNEGFAKWTKAVREQYIKFEDMEQWLSKAGDVRRIGLGILFQRAVFCDSATELCDWLDSGDLPYEEYKVLDSTEMRPIIKALYRVAKQEG